MNLINTKIHGLIDYLFAAFLIASPWIVNSAYPGSAAQWVPVVLGGLSLVISLCTNYELGAFKVLDMRMNLLFDAMLGLTLALSPWIFDFYDLVFKPHLLLGSISLVITLLSRRYPYARDAKIARIREEEVENKIGSKAG